LNIAEKGHVRPTHRRMQALGEICPARVSKRAELFTKKKREQHRAARA